MVNELIFLKNKHQIVIFANSSRICIWPKTKVSIPDVIERRRSTVDDFYETGKTCLTGELINLYFKILFPNLRIEYSRIYLSLVDCDVVKICVSFLLIRSTRIFSAFWILWIIFIWSWTQRITTLSTNYLQRSHLRIQSKSVLFFIIIAQQHKNSVICRILIFKFVAGQKIGVKESTCCRWQDNIFYSSAGSYWQN